MSDVTLTIVAAGPHVTIQDQGRPGQMRFGVPASGPLDRSSALAANTALGNPPGSPLIEVSMGGLTLRCEEGTVSFAVAGGGFIVETKGQKRSSWTIATLQAGETLSIRPGPWGSWCYLAFAGDLQSDTWLGSAATHGQSNFGGGRINSAQKVHISNAERRDEREGDILCPVSARPRHEVGVTLGPQDRFFDAATIRAFTETPWTMTGAWDRMGVRLDGPSLVPASALDMPSEPIVRGSIQVAGDGVPTVLLSDHQTTGGYPKIATLLEKDIDAFVQLRPRDQVLFRPVNSADAIQSARRAASSFDKYLEAVATPRGTLNQRLMRENLISGVTCGQS